MLASQDLVDVHVWPQRMQLAVDELRSSHAFTVISVLAPATTDRSIARDLIRTALRETLGVLLDQPAAAITLISHPGQAIRVDSPLARLQVSVSHMPGMSLIAIAKGAAIGVDAMHIDQGIEMTLDWTGVALDYLGPELTALLQRTAPAQRSAAFAREWTRFEACLKYLGLAMTEWTPVLAQQLATCRVMALALPENCRGAIATDANPFVERGVGDEADCR